MASTLVFELCIQINGQISIPRNWLKVKLHCVISLGLGLKRVKITQNVAKVGVHACLSMGIQIYDQISIMRNLSEVKLYCPFFARVGLKGGPNSLKRCKSWDACLYIKHASKSMIKFQFQEFSQKRNSIMQFR